MDGEKLIDLLWKIKEGTMHPNRAYKNIMQMIDKDFYCQREIEGESKCEVQCEHCKEYYKPLQK